MKKTLIMLMIFVLCALPASVFASPKSEVKEFETDRFYKYINGKLYEISDSENEKLLESKARYENGLLSEIETEKRSQSIDSDASIMAAVPVDAEFVQQGENEEYHKWSEETPISDIVQGPAKVGYELQKTYSWSANIGLTAIQQDAIEAAAGITITNQRTEVRSAEWDVPSGVRGQVYFVPIFHNVWGNLTTTYYVSPGVYYEGTNWVDLYTPHNYGYVYLKKK